MDLRKIKYIWVLLLVSQIVSARGDGGTGLDSLSPLANTQGVKEKDVRLVYLWASWCPDCREKLRGDIPKIASEYKNIDVITVNKDRSAEKAKGFITETKLSLPVLRDEGNHFSKQQKLFAVPSWVVVKKSEAGWTVIDKQAGSDLEKIKLALSKATGDEK